MKLEASACYLCHATDSAPWGEENGFHMIKCVQCGLVYLNPRPILTEVNEAARTGLHRFAGGGLDAIGRYSPKKTEAYRAKLVDLLPGLSKSERPVRWLDIGAGFGELVEAVRLTAPQRSKVLGIEPCEPKVRKARALNLSVDATPLSAVEGPFTHVSLVNVFSHVPDPIDFLRGLHHLMDDNATLVLVTGNGGDIPRAEFPGALYLPDHLSFAGEDNLRTILDTAGFEITAIDQYAETYALDSRTVTTLKNLARRAVGKPVVPTSLPKNSRFRSLWIAARYRG